MAEKKIVVDVETGEEREEELTPVEQAKRDQDAAEAEALELERQAEEDQAAIDETTLRDALGSGTVPEHMKAAIRRLGIRP